MLKYRFQDINN